MKRAAFLCAIAVCASVQVASAYTITGSRTMYGLNVALTAKYHADHPAATFTVSDAGTGKGIDGIIAGTIDVASVTRRLRPAEVQALRQRAHTEGHFVPVAREGISIYVHPQNRVEALTIQQLADIYSGKITNWKAVGGADLPIHLYAFDISTGRHWYVIEEVLKKEKFAPATRYTTEKPAGVKSDAEGLAVKEQEMLKWVSSDPSAIGFGDLKKIRVVKIVKVYNGAEAYWPTPDDVASGRYPLQRTLGYLMRTAPSGALDDFLRSAPAEADIIRSFGFVPVQ